MRLVPCRPRASTTSAWGASTAGRPRARRPARPAVRPSQPNLQPTPASTPPWHQSSGLPSWASPRLLPGGPLPGHAMRSALMRPSGTPSFHSIPSTALSFQSSAHADDLVLPEPCSLPPGCLCGCIVVVMSGHAQSQQR